jgi:hypothetical protein
MRREAERAKEAPRGESNMTGVRSQKSLRHRQ